jgi:hypothetical protein
VEVDEMENHLLELVVQAAAVALKTLEKLAVQEILLQQVRHKVATAETETGLLGRNQVAVAVVQVQ